MTQVWRRIHQVIGTLVFPCISHTRQVGTKIRISCSVIYQQHVFSLKAIQIGNVSFCWGDEASKHLSLPGNLTAWWSYFLPAIRYQHQNWKMQRTKMRTGGHTLRHTSRVLGESLSQWSNQQQKTTDKLPRLEPWHHTCLFFHFHPHLDKYQGGCNCSKKALMGQNMQLKWLKMACKLKMFRLVSWRWYQHVELVNYLVQLLRINMLWTIPGKQ